MNIYIYIYIYIYQFLNIWSEKIQQKRICQYLSEIVIDLDKILI